MSKSERIEPGDLVEGVEKGTMMELAKWTTESCVVLAF